MTAQVIQNQFLTFNGTDGAPLEGGYVYIGEVSQDPQSYPVAVFYDEALTIPATLPLRTSGGYVYRNGSPTNVWVNQDVSVQVLDSTQQQVYYNAKWLSVGSQAANGAKEWATKITGTVDGSLFSAKEYAAGSQAATGGSAKNWAQQTGADVTGATVNSRSAKSWAQDNLAGATLGGSAKDWAQSASSPDGVNKSAKSYSTDAAAKALEASNYAAAAATGAKFFDTIALGNAGVADGASFGVKAGGVDGLTRNTVYRRESAGVSTLLFGVLPASEYDAAVPAAVRLGYSSAASDGSLRVFSTTTAALSVTASGQDFYVPHAILSNTLTRYTNVAGVATDTGRRFNQTTGAEIGTATSLLGSEPEGLSIDFSCEDVTARARIIDSVTPANNYLGGAEPLFSGATPGLPRIVTLKDGTLGYSDMNLIADSEGFNGGNWVRVGCNVSAPSGGLCTITATAASADLWSSLGQNLAESVYSITFIGKAGTAPIGYIHAVSTTDLFAYFNLTTGTVGTVSAGVTANIYTTYEDGTALPAGEYRMVMTRTYPSGAASMVARYGIADADGAQAVTVGRTGFLRRSTACWGSKWQKNYLKTTGTSTIGLPYDYSRGGRRLVVEPLATFYNGLYSDDLTKAAWVKTNSTAALDATGPHGEACSSITATANNATCLQAVTASTANTCFQARVKRRTGSGAVFMTIDGGTNWTDITTKVNSAGYTLSFVKGTSTAVNMGFKLAVLGDVVEVALAVVGAKSSGPGTLTLPMKTFGATTSQNADVTRIALTRYNSTFPATIYFDMEVGDDPSANGEAVQFSGASDFHMVLRSSNNMIGRQSTVGGVTNTHYLGDAPATGGRFEVAFRLKANDVAGSVNGFGEVYDNRVAATGTLANLNFGGGGGSNFIRRILVVPRAVPDDGLAKWRYSGAGADARYLADIKIARHGETPNTFICREPNVEVLRDTDTEAILMVGAMQRYITPNPDSGEAPGRIITRTVRFDKITKTLSDVSGLQVVAQQPSWTSGLGHQQGTVLFKVKYGQKKGRLLCLYAQLDTADGRMVPDWRRVYVKYSDDNGTTWSAETMIYDPGTPNKYAIPTGPGNAVQFTLSSPFPGRIMVPFYAQDKSGVLYSDDGGTTWTAGAQTNIGYEPTVHILPDERTAVLSMREEGAPWRHYATSTNGGATWSASITAPGLAEGTNVAMALIQNDPDGSKGMYGETLLCGVRVTGGGHFIRSKLTIEEVKGGTYAVSGTQYTPLGVERGCGYTSAAPLSGGYLAIGYESSPTGVSNSYCDIRMMVVKWP